MVNEKGVRTAEDEADAGRGRSGRTVLIIAALDMSWRLAIVVLVPIIGGFELDKHLGIAPVLTIVGFLLAMAGLFLVLKRTVTAANTKYKTGARR